MKKIIYLLLLLSVFNTLSAQIAFTDPGTSNLSAGYCPEYFHEEWDRSLNMTNAEDSFLSDIPSLQVSGLDSYQYGGGVAKFTATNSAPTNVLLQYKVEGSVPVGTRYGVNHRINSAYYKVLSFRMYSPNDGTGEIIWYHDFLYRTANTSFTVKRGWHVYSIDLPTAAITSSSGANIGWEQGSPEGLTIVPLKNHPGAQIQYDWIRLTPRQADCQSFNIAYDADPIGDDTLTTVFIDNDTDLTNGYLLKKTNDAVGVATQSFSTQLLPPATYKVLGIISSDYATSEFYNPFDMTDDTDVKNYYQISNPHFAELNTGNYAFRGTTTGSDPSFQINIPKDNPLNVDIYKKLSIKAEYSGTAPGYFEIWFFSNNGATFRGQKAVPVSPGLNNIQVDLSSIAGLTGFVDTVRFDPATATGVNFSIDYASFQKDNYVGSLNYPTVTVANADLEIRDLGINFISPDRRGGREFSQTVLGNPWLMNDEADLGPAFNIYSAAFLPYTTLIDPANQPQVGDFFRAYNIPYNVSNNGDPLYFSLNYDAGFNPDEFVNICFRGWNQTEDPSLYNSVARIIWQDPREGNAASAYKNGDDIVMTRGVQEYCVDMREQATIEPALPQGAPNPWTSIGSNNISYFRVDLNENVNTNGNPYYYSVFDYIFLRTDHEANASYAISIDAPLSQEVSLYANTVKTTSGGNLIGTLAAGRNTNIFKWNTSGVGDGTYYIYGVSTGNGNTYRKLAEGRIKVDHSRATDVEAPRLVCDRPYDNYSTDSSLEVSGYALDETRLASIELQIDNTFYDSFLPHKFNKAARDAYSNLSGSNHAGFQKVFDLTNFATTGAHSYKIIATDTAGNEASCQGRFNFTAGTPPPSLLEDPATNNDTIPLIQPTPTPTPVPTAPPATPTPVPPVTISATSKGNIVTLQVTNTVGCPSVKLAASRTSKLAKPVILATVLTRGGTVTKTAKLVPSYKQTKKDKDEDGNLYFQAICSTKRSAITKLSAKLIKNTKKNTETNIITHLKKNLK